MRKVVLLIIFCFVLSGCSAKAKEVKTADEEVSVVENNVEEENEEEIKTSTANIKVLKYAVIPTGEHNASADVDFNDDRTVVLTNFYYDGKAPDVYITLGNFDDNGAFIKGVIVTPLIEGVYKGDEYKFTLASDIDLNDYSAISIWCDNYSEDFSSANIIDIN